MAEKIAQYIARDVALRPTNTGYSAMEMAGRRVGPFATQAANAIKEVANLHAKLAEDMGQQQTAFARFNGLYEKTHEDTGGAKIRYGGGLKDMFQLGAGGREPNIARLNRLSELQDKPVQIASAARHLVNAQSPLTTGLAPSAAWIDYNGKNAIKPIPTPTDKEAEDAGFNVGGSPNVQTADPNDPWSDAQQGPPVWARDKNGSVTGTNLPAGVTNPMENPDLSGLPTNGPASPTYNQATNPSGFNPNASPSQSTLGQLWDAVNPVGPLPSDRTMNNIATWGGLLPAPNGDNTQQPQGSATLPPTNSQEWPTPDGQPPNPAPQSAPSFWSDLNGGM